MKKKLIIVIIILILKIDVNALTYGGCDYSSVSRMRSLVSNINISYDYHIIDNMPYFDVTLTNITPDLYFIDSYSNVTYTYDNTSNGEITIYNYRNASGKYKFYSALSSCYGTSVGSKYYSFPTYNPYYTSEYCEGIPNFSLCQKWVNVNYSSREFEELVSKYKESLIKNDDSDEELIEYKSNLLNKVIQIYVNYYYYFLGAIILICGIIIIINKKNDRFKL